MQKLNRKMGYGTVMGHSKASYEQDGKLFDSEGFELTSEKTKAVKVEETELELQSEAAESFLRSILKAGAVSKSVVYREVEVNNQDWASVNTAAAKLEVKKYKRGSTEMWKLTETN